MRSPLVRWLYALLLAVVIAGCSGGGCSGCAGGAIQPIRGGFALTPERRIPHAIQVRLTEQGLRSVEGIAPGLFGSFLGTGIAVPRTAGSSSGFNYVVCPPSSGSPMGGCNLRVELATEDRDMRRGLELTFAPTDSIAAKIRIRAAGMLPVSGCLMAGGLCTADCRAATSVFGVPIPCPGLGVTIDINTMRGRRSYIGLATNISLRRDMHAERQNFIRADLLSPTGSGDLIQEAMGEGIEDEDIQCTNSGLCFIVNLLRGVIIGQVRGQLAAAVTPIQDALAHSSMPSPPGCPTGTTADGARCRYSDRMLVPLLLGADGEGNLGALLSSVTAGVRARNRFLVAAGDPDHGAEVTATGLTLNMFGAVESDGHNNCVPRVPRPMAPAIPEFMALRQNMVPGTSNPMQLGLGISETFLNSALFNMWDSGTFCLGVTSRLAQQLSAAFLGGLPVLRTLSNVTFPGSARAAAAIVLRPQQAPVARIGRGTNVMTDPLITLTFPRLALDFYAWSEERYVRFMTVTTDLSVPLNLMQEGARLQPVLGNVALTMTETSNTQLLSGNLSQLGPTLQELLGSIVGMFAGSIPPVALPGIPIPGPGGGTVGNVSIVLPEGGIAGVTEGSDRFLGLFANLVYVPTTMGGSLRIGADATLEAEILPFDASVYALDETFSADRLPRVRVRGNVAMNPEGRRVEYSYRVDRMTWSAWTSDSYTDLAPSSFLTQGVHVVEARARFEGDWESVDNTPAISHVVIDTRAPSLRLDREGDRVTAAATDEVSEPAQLEYRWVLDGVEQPWGHEASIALGETVARFSVTVRDANGNTAQAEGSRDPLIIRGGPSTDASSGCGCSTPGSTRGNNNVALYGAGGALFALALLLRRRASERRARAFSGASPATSKRARALPWLSTLALFSLVLAACGAGSMTGDGGREASVEAGPTCTTGQAACGSRCVTTPTCMCPRGQAAMGMPLLDTMTCMYDSGPGATACNCTDLPALNAGMAGSHLDMAVGADNAVWMSAYSAGDALGNKPYGDLIVGRWNMAMSRVDWVHVDGVPAMGEVTGLITGWRGGVVTPGDDVGRWNSIALTSMNQPRVAYWNTTSDRLQFASSANGTMWTTSVVDATGKAGRFASMVMLAGDIPAIAYRATVRQADGSVTAFVRYARANNSNPRAATDWTVTTVASAPTQCRASDCNTGEVCVQETGRCVAPSGMCPAACGAGQSCIAGACKATYTATWVEDFGPGTGQFISLAVNSMGVPGVVFYDRDRGNLMGARAMSASAGAMWQSFLIDGEDAMMRDQGDRGAWSTLAIGADGVWHVAYIDGWDETLRYVRVMDGVRMGEPEEIDAGTGIGAMEFTDGKHIVGDSASIEVTTAGGVRVAYQDSSAGTLRLATRGAMGAWTTSVVDMVSHTGYWARLRRGQIGTFWRNMQERDRTKIFGVRVLRAP